MLTSKQRAQLRGIAATEDTIVQIGKGGITENTVKTVADALKAREIVKGRVLENSLMTAREACDALSELHESFDPPISHRDLKPSNVILSQGALTLIDFGIARSYDAEADVDTHRFGTRAYAPPSSSDSARPTSGPTCMRSVFCCTTCSPSGIPTPMRARSAGGRRGSPSS